MFMRFSIITISALLAAPAAAQAPQSAWGFFEANGGAGVGVQAQDGTQLMLKCDKPGPTSVYAVVATKEKMVPPAQRPVMREVRVRFDTKSPFDDHWRFFENTAMAVNKGNERSLSHLLNQMPESQALELLLYFDPKSRVPMTVKFNIGGAKAAIDQVFASCKDTIPTSAA
jgi:hypothetical protein